MDDWTRAIKDLDDAIFEMSNQGMTREDVKRMVDDAYDRIVRSATARAYGRSRALQESIDKQNVL